jgi:signal transduction histidine kinase
LREASATVEPAAAARGVRIELTGPGGTLSCRSDPQRIRQILVNLLSNAVRHSPDKDAVSVSVAASDGALTFEVADRGPGLTPEQQEMIFEAFVQAGTKQERGTGLGLTLSRQLARLLGGDLRVTSDPGAGARFILQVPRYSTLS